CPARRARVQSARLCDTTHRQIRTNTRQSSILRPRLEASAPRCQGYPAIWWTDATARFVVAKCIRDRNTIVPGRVPAPTTFPCAGRARVTQPLRMYGKAPFPFPDWQRRALFCQSERPLRTKEVNVPNAQGPGPRMAPENQALLPAVPIVKL